MADKNMQDDVFSVCGSSSSSRINLDKINAVAQLQDFQTKKLSEVAIGIYMITEVKIVQNGTNVVLRCKKVQSNSEFDIFVPQRLKDLHVKNPDHFLSMQNDIRQGAIYFMDYMGTQYHNMKFMRM